jgi:16S rRNA (cytidine1402-2'-O)-methyltransferase
MSLFIVATPIGNMEDITIRALNVIKEVDIVLSEDTRVTRKLLERYNIKKPLVSFHQHSRKKKFDFVVEKLKEGSKIAFLSDAGTPNISDPGGELVSFIRLNLPDVKIDPIPGPSAITTALSISGINVDKFLFFGFLPHKKGRRKAIKEILESKYPVILYESKYRIIKLLKELKEMECDKKIIILREMTKIHYSFYEGDVDSLYKKLEQNDNDKKGEFTVIIY